LGTVRSFRNCIYISKTTINRTLIEFEQGNIKVDGWTLCSAEYKRVVDKVVKIVDDEHNKILLVSFSLSLYISLSYSFPVSVSRRSFSFSTLTCNNRIRALNTQDLCHLINIIVRPLFSALLAPLLTVARPGFPFCLLTPFISPPCSSFSASHSVFVDLSVYLSFHFPLCLSLLISRFLCWCTNVISILFVRFHLRYRK
jgi:hypothetical protein